MAVISTLITELRTDLSDDGSTRFTDTQLLNLFKKAIRRCNKIVQRNGLQFAKKRATITTVANQNYIDISDSVSDFDVMIALYRPDIYKKIPFRTDYEWESLVVPAALDNAYLDYENDKILFKGAPSEAVTLYLYYYPTVDPSAYTVASSTPWNGRLDDAIMEYVGIRAKNIDEMDLSIDQQLFTDMENQILNAYAPNAPTMVQGIGWL